MNGSQGSEYTSAIPEDVRKGLLRMVSGKKGIKERWKLFNEIFLMALQASCFMMGKRQVTQ